MGSKSDTDKRKGGTAEQVKNMCPQQRARYLAYAEPPKEVRTWMAMSRQRISAQRLADRRNQAPADPLGPEEQRLQDLLIGQMRAAEAQNRIRQMRLHYNHMRTQEISLMVSSQPSTQAALRLELLLPEEDKINTVDCLDKLQRRRVEEILEDEKGLTLIRG